MAIAFDSQSTNSSAAAVNSVTLSHTTSGLDRILFVGIKLYNSGSNADLLTGITYNGVPMTQVTKTTPAVDTTIYLYYLTGPTIGTNNIVASSSGNVAEFDVRATSYTGARQSGQPDANNSSNFTASPINLSTTTNADNCWNVGFFADSAGGAISAGTGTTVRTTTGFLGAVISDSNSSKTPPGSFTLQVTAGSTIAGIVASFAPVYSNKPFYTPYKGSIGRFFAGDPTLKGYWQLDGSSVDNSGNGNNGTDTNVTYVPGKFGRAASFNGTSSVVNIIDNISLRPTIFTLLFWFNMGTQTNYAAYFQSSNDKIGPLYYGFLVDVSNASKVRFTIGKGDSSAGICESTNSYNDNIWRLATCTFDGSIMKVYINGILNNTTAYANSIVYDSTNNINIGRVLSTGGSNIYWTGKFSEPALLSRVISPQEISSYYLWATSEEVKRNWLTVIQRAVSNFFLFFD